MNTTGTIIALAWPDTKVVKEGKWYDIPMNWFGFLKDDYYTAGHAAFLLINHQTSEVHYFDYGRYHTPYQYGRVRDKETDPDIAVNRKAIIENGKILNLNELILDRYYNQACHGEGRLTAAVVKKVCFDRAYHKAKSMQEREAIPYGPFKVNGSTCSRLVVQVVMAATDNKLTKMLIRFPYTISATPRSNNKVLNDEEFYYEIIEGEVYKKKNTWYPLRRIFTKKPNRRSVTYKKLVPNQV